MSIIWAPTTAQEIVQNVETIIATDVGTVPLARAFGTPQDVVDSPESALAAQVQAAVIKAVRKYEPRAPITSVAMVDDGDGKVKATVVLEGEP